MAKTEMSESTKKLTADLRRMTRDDFRREPQQIPGRMEHWNKLRAQRRGLNPLSPAKYLEEVWGFKEPETSEILKKAGYVV